MADESSTTTAANPADEVRMSFGDHLEAFRGCLLRGLLGTGIAIVLAMFFGKRICGWILQPLLVVLHRHGQPAEVMALSPPEAFIVYLKVSFLTGLIVSMPWLVYQLWDFVATGLYKHERRFARLFVPLTSGLFAIGVAFLYWVVLPVVLNFFVSFSAGMSLPGLDASWLQERLLPAPLVVPEDEPDAATDQFALLAQDPIDPQPGDAWVNTRANELRVKTYQGLLVAPLRPIESRAAVASQFTLQFYISFVLSLALAFGLSFELPIIVVFLAMVGIFTPDEMGKARKFVLFGVVVAAAFFTPPDVVSQILLAIPMMILFEGGLIAARMMNRRKLADAEA